MRWTRDAGWPAWVTAAISLVLLLLLVALLASRCRRRSRRSRPAPSRKDEPLNGRPLETKRASKLSNLEAMRCTRGERPTSCGSDQHATARPPPLNNIDTLRSYGSAGTSLRSETRQSSRRSEPI